MSSPIEKEILEKYAVGRGANIGCGDVQISDSMGVDIDPNKGCINADACFLPFSNGSLDYIISCNCLEHCILAPLMVLREWVRCVKIGGIIAAIVPEGLISIGANTKKGRLQENGHVHIFSKESLAKMLEYAGTEIIKSEVIIRKPYWKTNCILVAGKVDGTYKHEHQTKSTILWLSFLFRTVMPGAFIAKLKREW